MLHHKKIFLAIILTTILLLGYSFLQSNKNQVFYGDALGYYSYLPAALIHQNLDQIDDLALLPNLDPQIKSGIASFKYNYPQNQDGNTIIQYTYGIAAINALGFIPVYIIDRILGRSPTGFEFRYQNAIKITGLIFLLLGLYFCYLFLLNFFSKTIASITTSLLLFGTNLLWFGFYQFGMAHIPLFFLYALLLHLSYLLGQRFRYTTLIFIALTCGLICIIRPTDIIAIFIPIIFFFRSIWLSPNGHTFIKNHWWKISLVSAVFFIIPILPQLVYWKSLTGDWLFYSYNDQGFNWFKPKILAGLFGAKNGWFTYTPLMFFAIWGFYLKDVPKPLKLVFYAIVPLYIYISYAWWCYNYINGFGSRPMIHIYPILALGIAHILSSKNELIRFLGAIAIGLSTLINLNYIDKANRGLLYSDESTAVFNRATFFKNQLDYNDLLLLDIDDKQPDKTLNCQFIQSTRLDTMSENVRLDSIHGFYYYDNTPKETYPQVQLDHQLSPEDLKNQWLNIEVTGLFEKHVFMSYWHHKLVFEVNQINGNKIYKSIRINDKLGKSQIPPSELQLRSTIANKWEKVHFYVPTNGLQAGDKIKIYIWNTSSQSMKIKNITLSGCL